jgi:hypothetical protein
MQPNPDFLSLKVGKSTLHQQNDSSALSAQRLYRRENLKGVADGVLGGKSGRGSHRAGGMGNYLFREGVDLRYPQVSLKAEMLPE